MSADARNTVNLLGGLVDTPEEIAGGKVLRARLAVDYAGNDSANKDNRTGYFTLKIFQNDGTKFIFDQFAKGNLKKGSQIAIVGRLEHSRWSTDDGNRSEVQIVVESMSYIGGGSPRTTDDTAGVAETAQATTENQSTTNTPSW